MTDPFKRLNTKAARESAPDAAERGTALHKLFEAVFGADENGEGPYTHSFTPSGPYESEESEYGEVTYLTGDVRVPCVCGHPLVRAQYPPFAWVHDGDETVISRGVVVEHSQFDHLPQLAVIDVEVEE